MTTHYNISAITQLPNSVLGKEVYSVIVTFNLDSGAVTGNSLGYVIEIDPGTGKVAIEAQLEIMWSQENGYDIASKKTLSADIASLIPAVVLGV